MSGEEEFVAFITKYALSQGILRVRVRLGVYSSTIVTAIGNPFCHFINDEWHRSWVNATNKAEDMRIKKIALLKAQIDRLEKLKWVAKETS